MRKLFWAFFIIVLLCSGAGCRRTPSPKSKDRARIVADLAEVKRTRATLAPLVTRLHRGDEVEILSREPHWLRIRTLNGQEGWIEEGAALNQSIIDAETKLVAETRSEGLQAVGELSAASNLHISPGRDTPVIMRLPKEAKVEIFDRTLTDRPAAPGGNNPPPGSSEGPSRRDPWLKIRTEKGDAGWVYSPSVNFSVPDEIVQYSESRRIVAWLVLDQVEREDGKKVNQYVVADVEPGVAPEYDFDRIRVFTWNRKRNRYETAYRQSKIFGVYPIRVFTYENKPAFEINRLNEASPNSPKTTERYFMNGVLVRRLGENGQPASPAAHPRRRRR